MRARSVVGDGLNEGAGSWDIEDSDGTRRGHIDITGKLPSGRRFFDAYGEDGSRFPGPSECDARHEGLVPDDRALKEWYAARKKAGL